MFFIKCVFVIIIQTTVVMIPSNATNVQQNETSLVGIDTISYKHENVSSWSVIFEKQYFNMTMTQKLVKELTITFKDADWGKEFEFRILPQDKELLSLSDNIIAAKDIKANQTSWSGNFTVEALFLGRSKIFVELHRPHLATERSKEISEVIILRNVGKMDLIFNICVGIFVLLLNINFGAVLELDALKAIVIKPIGPVIGFIGQFVIMPVLGYLIGYFFFFEMIELRLGLFFTGCTPGGGASNIFTVILNGNLNLSITMTAISNLVAFGMMPLWIFTLGTLIFKAGNLLVPYESIGIMSCSLMVPLCIGIALQKFIPKVTKKMTKMLKPISLCFIVFITVFAFTCNSYIFKLFSWKIIFATSALPWIGYILSYILALICLQSQRDALTIAIETGIQNTGIAIFMLNFTLPQPQADITSAIPIANSIMTPLPLLLLYVLKQIFCRTSLESTTEDGIKESTFTKPKPVVENEQKITEVEKITY